MCGSMVDIQSAAAEIARKKKKETNHRAKVLSPALLHRAAITKERNRTKLECGPMPNVMAALPNIGGALCSTPQCLADAHY